MNIQINPINFSCKTTPTHMKPKSPANAWIHRLFNSKDTFTRTNFDINNDLKKVRLKEKINEGRTSEVYKTNFSGYVVRIIRGMYFEPKVLTPINDPNGLTIAEDEYGFIKLMKYIKGEPLYNKGWIIDHEMPVKQYMNTFEKIINLPNKTFAQYIQNVINIRKNGYDIDEINPNNFLLDGDRIRIVDLEKNPNTKPQILLRDFNPFVNKYHLVLLLRKMTLEDIYAFSEKIKYFYNKIINVAQQEGYNLNIEELCDDSYAKREHLINYLYHKNWDMIKRLIKM